MLNILFVNAVAERGGGEVVLKNIVTNLDRAKYHPVVVFLNDGQLVEEFCAAGITVYVIEAGRFRQALLTIKTIWKLARIIQQEKIHIVDNGGLKGHLYGSFATLFNRPKVILHMHDCPIKPSKWEWLRKVLPLHYVIANSNSTLKYIQQYYSCSASLVYPGSESTRFYPALPDPALCRELALTEGQVSIAIFARLQHWKGVHDFIKAAALVREAAPQTRFFIVGGTLFDLEPDYPAQLQAQIERLGLSDAMQMLGHRHDIPNLMRAMDIVVSSSILPESFGMGLVEAMLCGKPLVATAIGGPLEIVVEGKSGFLVPPNQPTAMAKRLIELTQQPELRTQLGTFARERAQQLFTVQAMLEKLEPLYQGLVEHG